MRVLTMSINGRYDQLLQLIRATPDGDLISKIDCDELVKNEWVVKKLGWNIITEEGLEVLIKLGALRD